MELFCDANRQISFWYSSALFCMVSLISCDNPTTPEPTLLTLVTVMVHSREALDTATEASSILFGKSTKEGLEKLDEQTFLDVFDGVPQFEIDRDQLGQPAIELLTTVAPVFPSKGEMRKIVQGGGVSLNKEKLTDQNRAVTAEDLIDGKYLLAQKGKKNYYLLIVR